MDTLCFQFGALLPCSSGSMTDEVTGLAFKAEGCFGTCPVLILHINQSGRATLKAISHNGPMRGIYKGTLTVEDWAALIELIQYINPLHLKRHYAVSWTDDQSYELTLDLKSGRQISTYDYGGLGTIGLEVLYKRILALRFSQKWKRRAKHVRRY